MSLGETYFLAVWVAEPFLPDIVFLQCLKNQKVTASDRLQSLLSFPPASLILQETIDKSGGAYMAISFSRS